MKIFAYFNKELLFFNPYLVKSVFNAPVPVYCFAHISALSAQTALCINELFVKHLKILNYTYVCAGFSQRTYVHTFLKFNSAAMVYIVKSSYYL